MRFGLLGPLAVWTADGTLVTVPGLKVRALLADLLINRGRPVSADRLIDDLWGEEAPANPSATLQVRVSQLRKTLKQADGGELVISRSRGYLIEAADVDADRFADLTRRAHESGDPKVRERLLAEALELWRGPALADFADEEFARAAITKLEEQRLAAVESHAEARLELGLPVELADLVAAHPLRERLRAVHIRALYRAGRQSEALDSYRDLRDKLADELGLDPSPELAALHQAILEQDPGLSIARSRPPSNLPAPLTGLIGRDEALAEVRELLAGHRLVTLTGSGGVGKTRLAVEAARGLEGGYQDGVWLAELAGSRDVADHLAAVLDFTGDLADALAGRRILLVLDNCEHVVEQVAEVSERLLRAAPSLVILATSREPLGVPGEVVWSVQPLEGASAVELFVARASAAARGFALDEETRAAVELLCRRLDGIPLALELAATRVRALGVHGLVERLDDRFRLLATGHRGAPPRQQTLTAMIGWSWDLLGEPERAVLRRLAVHADGCTMEAAEAVCADPGADQVLDVLDLMARLVDRSLVTVAHGPGGVRYRLLESVSAYCADRLCEAGELEQVRLRHVEHYVELAERAEPLLYGHEQRRWLRRLDAEAANLRAALDHAPAELALRLVNALAWHWMLRGRLAEARRWLATALATEGQAAASLRARALAWQAGFGAGKAPPFDEIEEPVLRARAEWFVAYMSDDPVAPELVDDLLDRFVALGDRWGEAATLLVRTKVAHVRVDVPAIERDTERSAAIFAEMGDRWGALQANEWQASVAEMTGDYEAAARLNREGLPMAEELGLRSLVSARLSWLGWIAMQLGEHERAGELAERVLEQDKEHGDRQIAIFAGLVRGLAARRSGRLDLAERHLRPLLDPDAIHHAMVLVELGFAAEMRGDAAAALALHKEGLAAGLRIEGPRGTASALEGLAGALALDGRAAESAAMLGAAAAIREQAGLPAAPSELPDLDRITAACRAALGSAFDTAFGSGADLSPADALTRV